MWTKEVLTFPRIMWSRCTSARLTDRHPVLPLKSNSNYCKLNLIDYAIQIISSVLYVTYHKIVDTFCRNVRASTDVLSRQQKMSQLYFIFDFLIHVEEGRAATAVLSPFCSAPLTIHSIIRLYKKN